MQTDEAKLNAVLDPLKALNMDAVDMIFQHFDKHDVLNASLVSPSWFKVTEASLTCGEKLQLKFNFNLTGNTCCDFYEIKGGLISKRKYQNLAFESIHSLLPDIVELLDRWPWKKVSILYTHFNKEDFACVMNLIEGTVETLTIMWTTYRRGHDVLDRQRFTFPKLRHLELDATCGTLVEDFAANCTQLKTLKMRIDWQWNMFEQSFETILARNDQLKELEIIEFGSVQSFFDATAIRKFRFKLKTFLLSDLCASSASFRTNMLRFLEGQVSTLERLTINCSTAEEVQTIFKMPKLTELSISIYENRVNWANVKLQQNLAIETCNLSWKTRDPLDMLKAFFAAMPNLKILTIESVTERTLHSIAPLCPNVKELRITTFRAKRVSDAAYFPSLIWLEIGRYRISRQTKTMIHGKPREERTPFEQLLLESLEKRRRKVYRRLIKPRRVTVPID